MNWIRRTNAEKCSLIYALMKYQINKKQVNRTERRMSGREFMKNLNVPSVSDAGVPIDPDWQLEIYDTRMVWV